MKKILLTLSIIGLSIAAFANTVIITSSQFEQTFTVTTEDTINFTLESIHNAQEVSKESWDANDTTHIASGFITPFGGGKITGLSVGTHYYVCKPHGLYGMKGILVVTSPTATIQSFKAITVNPYPNPFNDVIHLETQNADQITITDLNGVKHITIDLIKGFASAEIDGSLLLPGVYCLNVLVNGIPSDSRKLLKK